jgi:flagellar hook-associated protein 1 FlgK
MSVTSILNNANTGLIAAQTQLRVVSDNVSNVNTPGYVRKVADQVALSSQGSAAASRSPAFVWPPTASCKPPA